MILFNLYKNNVDFDTQSKRQIFFIDAKQFVCKVTNVAPKEGLNMLRPRYSRYYSRKILFDCQLRGSVKILPVDEIKFFFDVVNNYYLNFHMKK